jgi:polar amino acid transport system substrate-binding protein
MLLNLRCVNYIRTFALNAIIVFSVGSTTPANAQQSGTLSSSPGEQKSACDTITIGGPASWQPVSYITNDRQQTGLGIDIIKEYAKRNGIDVEVDIELPWARALDFLLQGKIDVTAGAYFTHERQKTFQYSDPYYTDDIMVFQHSERRFGYRRIEDLTGYRGARPHGGSLGNKIDTYSRQELDMVYSPINDHIFDLLLAGHVDYVLLGRIDGVATIRKIGAQDKIIPIEPPISKNPVRLMFSRNSPCLEHVEQINKLIAELRNNGTLQERTDYHLRQTVFDFETGS